MPKLLNQDLGELEPRLEIPHYDRTRITNGIAHISIGNFHRAHLAYYLHRLLQIQPEESSNWGICGIQIMNCEKDRILCENLRLQDCLYTLTEWNRETSVTRVIGSITDIVYAPDDPQKAADILADEKIKIISLTITENGYCYNQSTGKLDLTHKDIKHDLENPDFPTTAIGHIVKALYQRKRDGKQGVTVMSCDNLPGNGRLTQQVIHDFAEELYPDLIPWIGQNVTFPNCMVDRITPETRPDDRSYIRESFDLIDACPVKCEDFIQWVLEDSFSRGRPPFENLENVGVMLVEDVSPYEKMKLRLLNASHSLLGIYALLLGIGRVDQAMQDPLIVQMIKNLMNEFTPTLDEVPGINLYDYKATLLRRFANSRISDQTSRLAKDSSGKIPKYLLPPLYEILQSGSLNFEWSATTIAGWIKLLHDYQVSGRTQDIDDPLRDELVERAVPAYQDPGINLHAFFSASNIFDPSRPNFAAFEQRVGEILDGFRNSIDFRETLLGFESLSEDDDQSCYLIEIIQLPEGEYSIKVYSISEEGSPDVTNQFKEGENFKRFLEKLYSSDSMLDDFVTRENWRSDYDEEENLLWHSDHILVDENAGESLDGYFGELCQICDELASSMRDSDAATSESEESDSEEELEQESASSPSGSSYHEIQGTLGGQSSQKQNTDELLRLITSTPGSKHKNEQKALRLIESVDIDVNAFYDNMTIICFAISNGFHKVVDKLIEKGADLNLEKTAWGNPLFFAAIHTNEEFTLQLLDRGFELTPEKINRLTFWEDYSGFSLFQVACSKGYSKLTQRLIAAGADLKLPNSNGKSPTELASFGKRSPKGLTEQRKIILQQLGEKIDMPEETASPTGQLQAGSAR